MQEDTRRLAQELQRACFAARTVDSKGNQLSFMLTSYLPQSQSQPQLRRPPLVQSLALTARGQPPVVAGSIVPFFAGDYGILDLSSVEEQFGLRCAPSETRQELQSSPRAPPSSSTGMDKLGDKVTLFRRNCSSGGPTYGGKRRTLFVPSLASIFLRLASQVIDPNFLIAATARRAIAALMRNNPALLIRPVLNLFAGQWKDLAVQ
uniref:Uncharacterized protein n=1 Tax=Mycena chlorophos TaxID=658473 RepID=A0ABQ0L7K8_MYCCL|nr:predicted protein [Mycena chlorophos]